MIHRLFRFIAILMVFPLSILLGLYTIVICPLLFLFFNINGVEWMREHFINKYIDVIAGKKEINILWPIKYMLRDRVKRYQHELDFIAVRMKNYPAISRQTGCSYTIANMIIRDSWMKVKYEHFIKRWSL